MTATQKSIDAARLWIPEGAIKWKEGIASGMLFDSDGNQTYRGALNYGACHAFLIPSYYARGEINTIVISQKKEKRGCKEETASALLKWLTEDLFGAESKRFILNSGNLDEIMQGGILLDATETGSDMAMLIAKLARHTVEEPHRADNWKIFVDNGIHPLIAAIATNVYSKNLIPCSITTHGSSIRIVTYIDEIVHAMTRDWSQHRPKNYIGNGNGREFLFVGYAKPKEPTKINWPAITTEQVKKPDGWGGFIYQQIPSKMEEFVQNLLNIQQQVMERINAKTTGRAGDIIPPVAEVQSKPKAKRPRKSA